MKKLPKGLEQELVNLWKQYYNGELKDYDLEDQIDFKIIEWLAEKINQIDVLIPISDDCCSKVLEKVKKILRE